MVQLPNIVCMFAMSTDQADKTYSISKRLFLCLNGSVVSKDIRLSNPYMAILTYCLNCLLGRRWDETAFSVSIHLKFIHSMTKQNEFCDARNNSTLKATCAHDTGKLPVCGNPYLDLAQHGFDLHSCDVRFLKKPNANGHTVTGERPHRDRRFQRIRKMAYGRLTQLRGVDPIPSHHPLPSARLYRRSSKSEA